MCTTDGSRETIDERLGDWQMQADNLASPKRSLVERLPLALLWTLSQPFDEVFHCLSFHQSNFETARFEVRAVGFCEVFVCEGLGYDVHAGLGDGLNGSTGDHRPVIRPLISRGLVRC